MRKKREEQRMKGVGRAGQGGRLEEGGGRGEEGRARGVAGGVQRKG